jgi:hypothetical protein
MCYCLLNTMFLILGHILSSCRYDYRAEAETQSLTTYLTE